MKSIYKQIKRRKHIHRLKVSFFLLIMFIELFSHTNIGQQTIAAATNSQSETIISSYSGSNNDEKAQGIFDDTNQHNQQTPCSDQSSHHHVLVSNMTFHTGKSSFQTEQFTFPDGELVYNPLPPPFQPPKKS